MVGRKPPAPVSKASPCGGNALEQAEQKQIVRPYRRPANRIHWPRRWPCVSLMNSLWLFDDSFRPVQISSKKPCYLFRSARKREEKDLSVGSHRAFGVM